MNEDQYEFEQKMRYEEPAVGWSAMRERLNVAAIDLSDRALHSCQYDDGGCIGCYSQGARAAEGRIRREIEALPVESLPPDRDVADLWASGVSAAKDYALAVIGRHHA